MGGSGVPTSGSVDSNTVTFGAIMPAVTQVARASEVAPFAVSETGGLAGVANAMAATAGTFPANAGGATGCGVFTGIPAAGATAAAGIGKLCGGLTNSQIQRATRGIASVSGTGTGPTVAANSPPIACISSSVCFNDILVPATNVAPAAIAGGAIPLVGNSRCVRLCDPKGAPALPGTGEDTYAKRKAAYATNRLSTPVTGTNSNQPTPAIGSTGSGYWDPITAAQASLGGFCCDAQYYSVDGVGRDQTGTYGTLATTPAAATVGTATVPDGTGTQNTGV